MGNVMSVLRTLASWRSVPVFAVCSLLYLAKLKAQTKHKRSKRLKKSSASARVKSKKRRSASINKNFIAQFLRVLKRGCGKREYLDFAALAGTLLARTLMSLWIANNMGFCVEALCNKRWDLLRLGLYQFGSMTSGAALLNALLKYFVNVTSLDVRQRLTRTVHTSYMKDMAYYKANKVADVHGVLENADQLIADDIAKFADTLSDVFSNLLKPVVDFVLFSVRMTTTMGAFGPIGMYSWFAIATVISAKVLPSYGRMAVEEQRLEGRFRAAHANLIHNAEMVAFMRGERPELLQLERAFGDVRQHVKGTLIQKMFSNSLTGYINKYFASVVGFALTSWPVYKGHNGMATWKAGQVANYYVFTRQMMEGLANAVLAIFDLQKRVGKLSGLTARVDDLLKGIEHREPILQDRLKENTEAGNAPHFSTGDGVLEFERVCVYKPDGTLLVRDLTFRLDRGQRVIVTGDNGCGKSSLFRVLRGLWPLVGGRIVAPEDKDVYFLSQVNFVPIGTLREIICYPHTAEEMKARGVDDAQLKRVLEWSQLRHFKCDNIHPELDDILEWDTALSPGQKQRMAFARLFAHQPKVAVLDECTNGISPDVEEDLYNRCAALGMAVFSISHKVELKRLHDFQLHFHADENGTYSFTPIPRS